MTDAQTASGPTATEAPWHRLSVRMLLVHPVMELIRFLPVLIAIVFIGSSSGHGGSYWGLIGLGVGIVLGLLRWATTQYRVTQTQVEVRRGILGRSVLTVPRDRVRSVDLTSHFLHRLLGLTRVAVGTGQTDRKRDSGVTLDGMPAADGARLREELLHRVADPAIPRQSAGTDLSGTGPAGTGVTGTGQRSSVRDAAGSRDTVLARLDPAWIRFGPFTMSGLVTVGVVAAFVWRTANETDIHLDQIGVVHTTIRQVESVPTWVAIGEVAVGVIVVLAILSTLAYVLAFWNFRLTRSAFGTLHVTRGLVTTRSITIEERRLRGVEYSEPLLLRAVRGARAIAITTGLRVGRGAERGGSVLLPPAPAGEVRRVAAAVLGDEAPLTTPLARHPRAALRRRLVRALLGWAVLVGIGAGLAWLVDAPMWTEWTVWVAVALLPVAALLGWDRYRSLGHAVIDRRVVFRQGTLVRRRYMIDGSGVVGWTFRQSVFQRGSGLVTLTATTAAGRQGYTLLDVDAGTAAGIADEVLPDLITPFLVTPGASFKS